MNSQITYISIILDENWEIKIQRPKTCQILNQFFHTVQLPLFLSFRFHLMKIMAAAKKFGLLYCGSSHSLIKKRVYPWVITQKEVFNANNIHFSFSSQAPFRSVSYTLFRMRKDFIISKTIPVQGYKYNFFRSVYSYGYCYLLFLAFKAKIKGLIPRMQFYHSRQDVFVSVGWCCGTSRWQLYPFFFEYCL